MEFHYCTRLNGLYSDVEYLDNAAAEEQDRETKLAFVTIQGSESVRVEMILTAYSISRLVSALK